MTNNTATRTALRATVASALIVIVTGLGAQAGWAAPATDATAPTAVTETVTPPPAGGTEDPAGSGTDNNPWD
ncbi:hypothetical protein P3L51_27285 [Streptomyces sp. PSRA5]|uniref:hypothetical protein n=1 Tax=Streptomyces panacea TaxID=3035064 RepID=UPI00339C9458